MIFLYKILLLKEVVLITFEYKNFPNGQYRELNPTKLQKNRPLRAIKTLS